MSGAPISEHGAKVRRGQDRARAAGVRIGRPPNPGFTAEVARRVFAMRAEGLSVRAVAAAVHVPKSTLHRALARRAELPSPMLPGFEGLADCCTPFVKWSGGKRRLVPELRKHVPQNFGTYHEPFVGGGALFFALRPQRAVLSDTNEDLVRAYVAVRDDVGHVISLLRTYPRSKDFFLEMRDREVRDQPDAVAAARFIYLLKCSFNGLWRVNARGRFNVPYGDNEGPVCDEPTLRACSAALRGVDIRREDFGCVLDRARPGDLVYFDPPYVPLSPSSSFTQYTSDGFSRVDHQRLRDAALMLKRRGVHVVLSNSSAAEARALYSEEHFAVHEVLVARSISSKADKRGAVTELVVT